MTQHNSIRRAILDAVAEESLTRATVLQRVTDELSVGRVAVRATLDELEARGEIYVVGEGEGAEVRRT